MSYWSFLELFWLPNFSQSVQNYIFNNSLKQQPKLQILLKSKDLQDVAALQQLPFLSHLKDLLLTIIRNCTSSPFSNPNSLVLKLKNACPHDLKVGKIILCLIFAPCTKMVHNYLFVLISMFRF